MVSKKKMKWKNEEENETRIRKRIWRKIRWWRYSRRTRTKENEKQKRKILMIRRRRQKNKVTFTSPANLCEGVSKSFRTESTTK
jgi:hypothetical protein